MRHVPYTLSVYVCHGNAVDDVGLARTPALGESFYTHETCGWRLVLNPLIYRVTEEAQFSLTFLFDVFLKVISI